MTGLNKNGTVSSQGFCLQIFTLLILIYSPDMCQDLNAAQLPEFSVNLPGCCGK